MNDTLLGERDFARIARAIRYIDNNFRAQPPLAAIAAEVDLSEFHFNRLFRRWSGLTPKQYLGHVTARAARDVLASGPAVLDAAYDVGLSSAGRLHDLTVSLEALTPGEIRRRGAGVTVDAGITESPFGSAFIAQTDRGICRLAFIDVEAVDDEMRALAAEFPLAKFARDDQRAASTARRIWQPGTERDRRVVLSVVGTNFQVQVWRALLALDGLTTYGALAATLGMPTAARAVGNAVGANPIAWLIPCHRVLRGDGSLGGYRWGVERKRAILAYERCVESR